MNSLVFLILISTLGTPTDSYGGGIIHRILKRVPGTSAYRAKATMNADKVRLSTKANNAEERAARENDPVKSAHLRAIAAGYKVAEHQSQLTYNAKYSSKNKVAQAQSDLQQAEVKLHEAREAHADTTRSELGKIQLPTHDPVLK